MPRLTATHLAAGAAAGAAATIPMSWAMEVMHRLLPAHEQQPLPPREITDHMAEAAGIDDLNEEQRLWLSLVAHIGYGAAVGALYAAVERSAPGRPLVKGTAYGLAVWGGSYLGLVPALGLLTPATRHPPRRTALMIVAHLVWGSAAAIFTDLVDSSTRREHPGFLGAGQEGHTLPVTGEQRPPLEHAR